MLKCSRLARWLSQFSPLYKSMVAVFLAGAEWIKQSTYPIKQSLFLWNFICRLRSSDWAYQFMTVSLNPHSLSSKVNDLSSSWVSYSLRPPKRDFMSFCHLFSLLLICGLDVLNMVHKWQRNKLLGKEEHSTPSSSFQLTIGQKYFL